MPSSGALGTRTTDFFCAAMAAGSRLLWVAVSNPAPTVAAVLAVLLLSLGASPRHWRPTAPLRLAHRRAWGQILSAAARMYVAHLRLFVGIGLLLVPISLLITLFQALLLTATSVLGIDDQAAGAGLLVLIALDRRLDHDLAGPGAGAGGDGAGDGRDRPGPRARAAGGVSAGGHPWPGAVGDPAGGGGGVAPDQLGAADPVAIWVAVRWALAVQVVVIEGGGAPGLPPKRPAGARPLAEGGVADGRAGLIAVVLGPAVGTALILATDLPLWLLNVIAGLVYVLTMPFVALATSYVYFDTRVSDELEAGPSRRCRRRLMDTADGSAAHSGGSWGRRAPPRPRL